MKNLRCILALAAALLLAPAAALAQTAPNWTFGYVPTTAQWNAVFASKQDTLGYVPMNVAGGSFTGRVVTAPPGGSTAGFNLTPGTTPATPANGDLWATSAGLFARIGGSTINVSGGGAPLAVGTTPVSGGGYGLLFNNSGVLGNAITAPAGQPCLIQNLFGGQIVGVPVNCFSAINDGATNNTRYIYDAAVYANANRLGLIFSSGSNYPITPMQFGGSNPTSGTATGSIAGTTLTVTTTPSVQIVVGQSVTCGGCTADTVVTGTAATPGWVGDYTVNNSQTVSSPTTMTFAAPSITGSIALDVLTATVNSGRLHLVDSLAGTGVIPGTTITAQLTGSAGLSGTYRVSYSQAVASTTIRAYPYTVAPIPNAIAGALGGESQTVLAAFGANASPHALVKIVDPPALGAVLGFQIASLRLNAVSLFGNVLMLHGFSASSSGGVPAARNLTLLGSTGPNCNMNMIGNAPGGGGSWGIIEATFSNISSAGAAVCDYNLNGDDGNGSASIQAVQMDSISANSASSGNGFKINYAEITCTNCLSQNHAGVPIAFNHVYHNQWINFYSEADAGGAITSTANTFGVKMTGTAVAGVDSGLLTGCTHDIDIHIGAGLGTFPTNTQRNFGCASGQKVIVNGDLFTLPSASTGVLFSNPNNGAILTGNGAIYDVSLVNKANDLPACGVLTGTRQLSCHVFDIGGNQVTLGGAFTMSGAFGFTGTLTGTTSVTFPTSGALAAIGTDTTYAFRANNLSDLASASSARTNLGLGTAATANTGTSGANIPLLNGANTWGSTQAFAAITATTINGNAFTTGTGTLTLGAGKTLTASNTMTLTATDGSSIAFGAGGTVLYSGGAAGGDLGGTYPNPTIASITSGAAVAGSLLHTNIAAPSTPASGKVSVWTDSTDLRLHDKNSAGTIGTTVVADTGAASNYISAISAAGVITKSRPACATLSDSAAFCSGTDAAGLTGTVATARISGSYTGITGVGTLTAGATGAGFTLNFATSTLSGSIPNANLTSLSANQVLGALTATTPSGLSVPSCSTAGSAIQWTSGTGFGCKTGVFSTSNAVLNAAPANPTGIASGTAVMMGLGASCTITPVNSTRVRFTITGSINNNTAADGASYRLAYGTSTAPINGAASSGTTFGSAAVSVIGGGGGVGFSIPFTATGIATGLSTGTAYWFDIQLAAITAGTASVQSLGCTADEV